MTLRYTLGALLTAAVLVVPHSAQAQGPRTPVIGAVNENCGDAIFNGVTFAALGFGIECWQITNVANDQPNQFNVETFLTNNSSVAAPDGWSYLGQTTDRSGSVFEDAPERSIAANGTFSFAPSLGSPFALSFKWGTQFRLYVFDPGTPTTSIDYDLRMYGNNGGALRSISHATALGSTVDVPEPSAIALLGVGLAGLAGVRVRRRRS
jgi:hypothetical protein